MSNSKTDYLDDPSWASIFEMAKEYEEQNTFDIYETSMNFIENDKNLNYKMDQYSSSEEALKKVFGYDSFREGQKSIIDAILSGQDSLAVMPTGAGKSLCYQIPAMMLPGITLVISPLISLMQDQVKALNEAGVSAAFLNSALTENVYFETLKNVREYKYKILYVAPERLITESFMELAKELQISMITVDEAHCISQWGQDFRPSYMKIVEFVSKLRDRPVISAFTATATETVRDDIVCTLGLKNPHILISGFNRENLFFQVEKPKNKDQFIREYIFEHQGESGIVYCATRKNVDSLYEQLKLQGFSVAKYHAGMTAQERKKMQDDFVFDYTSIVVATNAFGMGIDKSNVRFVIHYNMPQSMENYYQEAGRAGRDGLDAKCILLFSPQDIVINRFLLDHKEMNDMEYSDRETVKERDIQRLQKMEKYCYTTECLRNYILKYFGEKPEKPCEDCGNCLREFETLDMTEAAKKMINCVYEAKGRYGRTIIVDTLVGAQNARLKEIGAIGYKSYGILSAINKNILNRLMEQLILEGYLLVGDFKVIKMGNISALKNPDAKVLIKITDEDKLTERKTKNKKQTKGMEALTSIGCKLFEALRVLRLQIAREEAMPPYIIFSDKTLIDMAIKVPLTQYEMLSVSGVGNNKFLKYGERFLIEIEKFTMSYPEILSEKTNKTRIILAEAIGPGKKSKKNPRKEEFSLLPEEAAKFSYSKYKYITDIREELNRIANKNRVKRVTNSKLIEILMEKDLVYEKDTGGVFIKAPTSKGEACQIKLIQKQSESGYIYPFVTYPEEIQQLLVQHFIKE